MLGPRLVGRAGIALRPMTLEDQMKRVEWVGQPEATRFWAPRYGEWTKEKAEERYKRDVEDRNAVSWAIAYHGETVGFTGIFDIDWVRRDGESGREAAHSLRLEPPAPSPGAQLDLAAEPREPAGE